MRAVVTDVPHQAAPELKAPALLQALIRAQEIYRGGKPKQALERADRVLSRFRAGMDADTPYICLGDAAEAEHYQQSGPAAGWKQIDRTFCDALMFKAFLLVELRDLDAAMGLLQQAAEHAPLSPEPYNEMGYILNAKKRHADAFKTYHEALRRAKRHPEGLAAQAVALRGIGFALAELGDLRGARIAYLDALAIEPDNPVALNELRYLEHQLSRSPVE